MTWIEAIKKLQGFRDLADDWDGQGASPPLAPVIDCADSWLKRMRRHGLNPPARITPGVAGELYLEWWAKVSGTICTIYTDTAEFVPYEGGARIEWSHGSDGP